MINQFPICTPPPMLRVWWIHWTQWHLSYFIFRFRQSTKIILISIYLTSMEGRFLIFYGVFFIFIFFWKIIFSDTRNSEFLISKNHFLITKFWFFDVRNANWFFISQILFFYKMAKKVKNSIGNYWKIVFILNHQMKFHIFEMLITTKITV